MIQLLDEKGFSNLNSSPVHDVMSHLMSEIPNEPIYPERILGYENYLTNVTSCLILNNPPDKAKKVHHARTC